MNAWSSDAIAPKQVKALTPLERQGAIVFQDKQCRNCHEVDGLGGQRGPALDDVATTLTRDQLIRQVLQGGGNMPSYGKNLSPAEVEALVDYLETLHKPGQAPAVDESQQWEKLVQSKPENTGVPPVGNGGNPTPAIAAPLQQTSGGSASAMKVKTAPAR